MTIDAPPRTAAGSGLTDEQEEAVERRRGAMLLAANAGSGKTTVLVERFVRAVHEDGVAPSRILAITFTERAAGELRERVRRRLYELGDPGAARETEAAFVSTIHGFCARLLRAHPLAAGLAPGFAVLDDGTAIGLRQEAFEAALAAWMADERAVDLAAACGVDQLAAAIGAVHDELRSRGHTRPELPRARPRHDGAVVRRALADAGRALAGELGAARGGGARVEAALAQLEADPERVALAELKLHRGARALQTPAADAHEAARVRCLEAEADAAGMVAAELLGDLLARFAVAYARRKEARGALDFDDLELSARDLLAGDAELRARWSERFELLMVDELQDTNPREMAILAALDRGNLFTVGDEFQSIYGFRHAEVGIFRDRRRALIAGGGVRALSRNFRSRPGLLAAINATFAPLFGPDFVPLVAGRADAPAPEPRLELLLNDAKGWREPTTPGAGPAWRRAEAAILGRRIAELIATGGARPGEVVVLLRYATSAGIYERALAERGVPVASGPGGGFYAGQEVSDLAAYARVLANPLDDAALYAVLASPLGGVAADGLAVLGLAARALGRPPWEVLGAAQGGDPPARAALAPLGGEDRVRLTEVHDLIAAERRAAPRLGPAELFLRSDYPRRAACGPLGLANLQKLLRLAREFEARDGRDLRRFADRLAAGRLGSAREQDAQLADADAVRLMTVHAAKGLEFPVVCYADLGHGPPIGLPLVLTDGERVGLRLPTLDHAPRVDAFAYAALRARREGAALAEEQRIAYVAMTRARERLILSGAADFARWPAVGAAAPAIAWLAPAMVPDLGDRLAAPERVSELELGGVPLRLTLTAAGEEALDPVPAPPGAPPPAGRRPPSRPAQLSLFEETAGPAPATPPPDAVSYSSLADHARCGYGYYLRRVLGLAEVAPPPGLDPVAGAGPDPAVRGRIVHALLERLDFARPEPPSPAAVRAAAAGDLEPDPDEVEAIATDEGEAVPAEEVGAIAADEVEAIVGLVGAFAASPLCARLAAADTPRREASFALPLGDVLVGGYIDVLAREADGGLLVVDYKTDRIAPETDLAERVARDYEVQRRIYALAGLRTGVASVEVAYCFLRRPAEVVSARYAAADAARLERELAAVAAPLLAGRFPVTARPHRGLCATCPGRARLCSWEEAMTLREEP
jgi:ATP-dependent helicase/nuclease subunit A